MTWIFTALGAIKKVPWQIWVGIGLFIVFLWYGEHKENRGYEKCRLEVTKQTDKVNEELQQRELELFELRQEFSDQQVVFKGQLKGAQDEADKMREAMERAVREAEAKGEPPPVNIVCVPSSISDKLRNVGR